MPSTDCDKQQSQPQKDHPATRVLGDHSLTKTLGAARWTSQHTTSLTKRCPVQPCLFLPTHILPAGHQNHPCMHPSVLASTLSMAASPALHLQHAENDCPQCHYYRTFEYVNGGRMLDCISCRLCEIVVHRFARQIGSAFDCLHRNNVVRRSTHIHIIRLTSLWSRNWKYSYIGNGQHHVIDLGLSNLYNAVYHLFTFCGSFYFSASELLIAKVSIGAEVDLWSFGVVLYLLMIRARLHFMSRLKTDWWNTLSGSVLVRLFPLTPSVLIPRGRV